jgi:hypothetical protein
LSLSGGCVRKTLPNIAAALLAVMLSVAGAPASSIYDDALEKYKAGHFQQAAAGFASALVREPANQLYHYLLANCLVHMEQHDRAAEEYRLAYELDPASTTGGFCRQALTAYGKSTTQKSASGKTRDASELQKVKALIRRQAEFEKDKQGLLASRSESSIQQQVDNDLQRIDQWVESEIQKLREPIVYNLGPRANPLLGNPELLKQKEDQIRATGQQEKERVRKAAAERSQVYESWRKDREALLEESAGNLQTQLDQPMGRSGVKLQPHGTGLYVRYYGKGGPNLLPDPHPATVRIREADTGGITGSEAKASGKEGAGNVVRDVKGTVMKDSGGEGR